MRLKYEFSDAVSLSLGLGDDNAEDYDDDDDSESSLSGETDGAVVQLTLEPNDNIRLALAYLRSENNYGAIAQLILEPIDDIEFGLTYLRSYNNLDTGTGSELANDPFDDESDNITTTSYELEANIQVSSSFSIGGWVGLTNARATDLSGNPEATIFHYAVTLAFPDLGKEDSLAGVVIGQPPKVWVQTTPIKILLYIWNFSTAFKRLKILPLPQVCWLSPVQNTTKTTTRYILEPFVLPLGSKYSYQFKSYQLPNFPIADIW